MLKTISVATIFFVFGGIAGAFAMTERDRSKVNQASAMQAEAKSDISMAKATVDGANKDREAAQKEADDTRTALVKTKQDLAKEQGTSDHLVQELIEARQTAYDTANDNAQLQNDLSDTTTKMNVYRDTMQGALRAKAQNWNAYAGCEAQLQQASAQIQQRQQAGQITPENAKTMLAILKLLLH